MRAVELGPGKIASYAWLAWLSSCAPAAPESPPGDVQQVAPCQHQLAETPPELLEAVPAPLPTSRLVVTAQLEKEPLLAELARHVPHTLAHAKRRPIGAPGEVTYTVTRGAMDAQVKGSDFAVTTLANAEIEICKPLGPFCVTYGRCRPVLATTVTMPLSLTDDYAWQRPSTRVSAQQGCRIAGFDVTSRLTSIARSNLGGIQERIEQSLPEIKPWAARVWELAHNPVYLDGNHCLELTPERFIQVPPLQTATGYRMRIGLELTLELTDQCQADREPRPLAPLSTLEQLPEGSSIQLGQRIANEVVSRQLTQAFRGAFGDGEAVASIRASSRRIDDKNTLLLAVDLNGSTCGTAWLAANLKSVADGSLKLHEVRFLNQTTAQALPTLPGLLADKAALRPSLSFHAVAKRLEQLLDTVATLPEERLRVTTELGPAKQLGALVDQPGVLTRAELKLSVGVAFEHTATPGMPETPAQQR